MSAAEDLSHALVELAQLRLDGGTQTRAALSQDKIDEYAEVYGIKTMPAIVVFYDGADYWLADGFHRVNGAQKAGRTVLPAEVHQGTQRDAILYSVGANATHGLPRTNADKRRAVELLLRDEEWGKRSDRWIAEKCGVTHPMVIKMRGQLVTDTSSPERVGKDGKTRSLPRQPAPEPEPTPETEQPPQRSRAEVVAEANELFREKQARGDYDVTAQVPRPRPEMWWACPGCATTFNLESAKKQGWVMAGSCDDCLEKQVIEPARPGPSLTQLRALQASRDADPALQSWVQLQAKLETQLTSPEMRTALFLIQGGDLALLRLGLDWRCTADDLKQAFRDAVRTAHPDKGGTADEFREVQRAKDLVVAWLGIAP